MNICTFDGCTREIHAKGFCGTHYSRYLKTGTPEIFKFHRHGHKDTSEYFAWRNLKNRCYNKKVKEYENYGARGITVCDEWRHNFPAFLRDMGKKPFKNAQIDRIDNDKGYSKDNCHWVTQIDNARNKRNNKMSMQRAEDMRAVYEMAGPLSFQELADIFNVSHVTARRVISREDWA